MSNIIALLFFIQECFISATMNAFYLHDTGDYYTSKVVKLEETTHSEIFIEGYEYKVIIANSDSHNIPTFKSNGKQIKIIVPERDSTVMFEIENSICTSMVILFKR
jgi:hypothetical protein